jgi:protein-L-isoaspartate(D-aspartate) O-methyltransferase
MAAAERRHGHISDRRVEAAMAAVPREEFVPAALVPEAFDERALPIGSGQTISQPLMVAMMTQALELDEGDEVLEIGTGSGYSAAVLRRLVDHVTSVERIPELADEARRRLDRLGVDGVEIHCADGTLGWPDGAPYDAIVVTAGAPEEPAALIDQLAEGGRLVVPIGARGRERLVRFRRRTDGTVERSDLGAVAFVPLVGEQGWPEASE